MSAITSAAALNRFAQKGWLHLTTYSGRVPRVGCFESPGLASRSLFHWSWRGPWAVAGGWPTQGPPVPGAAGWLAARCLHRTPPAVPCPPPRPHPERRAVSSFSPQGNEFLLGLSPRATGNPKQDKDCSNAFYTETLRSTETTPCKAGLFLIIRVILAHWRRFWKAHKVKKLSSLVFEKNV